MLDAPSWRRRWSYEGRFLRGGGTKEDFERARPLEVRGDGDPRRACRDRTGCKSREPMCGAHIRQLRGVVLGAKGGVAPEESGVLVAGSPITRSWRSRGRSVVIPSTGLKVKLHQGSGDSARGRESMG